MDGKRRINQLRGRMAHSSGDASDTFLDRSPIVEKADAKAQAARRSHSARTSASPSGGTWRRHCTGSKGKPLSSRLSGPSSFLRPSRGVVSGRTEIGSSGPALRSARSEMPCRASPFLNVASLTPIVSAISRAARPWPARRRMRGLVSAVNRAARALGPIRNVAGGLLKSDKNLEAN
jgi:hypothetical protein